MDPAPGSHSEAIRMPYADYEAITRPSVMHLSHEYAGAAA